MNNATSSPTAAPSNALSIATRSNADLLHALRIAELAIDFAEQFGASPEKVRVLRDQVRRLKG